MTTNPSRPASDFENTSPVSSPIRTSSSSARERFFLTSDLEAAIAQMPTVRGVRIVANDSDIDEIHVMSTADVRPKALVRNIVTLLLVRFGVRVDHRRLSIIQSDAKPDYQLARPIIYAVKQTQEVDLRVVTVELRCGGQRVLGVSKLADDSPLLRGGSLALIDAVEKLLIREDKLELREASTIALGGHELVIVLIAWHGASAEELFVGAAFAAGDPVTAAARGALDAINRKLVRLPVLLSG